MSNDPVRGLLSEASWIWPDCRLYDLRNRYAQFRKDFVVERSHGDAILSITADQCYRLWVNGRYVTRGPARGYQESWPYDEVDVAPYLREGGNRLCVEAYNGGVSTFGYVTQTSAGFLCAGNLRGARIRSDASWISRYDAARARFTALYSFQLTFQEHADARKADHTWRDSPLPPAMLTPPAIVPSTQTMAGLSPDFRNEWHTPDLAPFGAMPWHDVEPRGIPQLRETPRNPVRLVSRGCGATDPAYREWYNIASGLFGVFEKARWEPAARDSSRPVPLPVRVEAAGADRFSAVILDFGEEVVGPASVTVTGPAGTVVDFFYSECLQDGVAPFLQNPDTEGGRVSLANRLILREGSSSFDFFQILGFRYATVIVHESPSPLDVELAVNDTGYPYAMRGSFECSDETLNAVWGICRRTEQICSLDAYVDTPWREQAQWWGDARIQFANTMAMDGDTRLFARGIRTIARQRVPNGLTYGHAPTMAHTCILPDFSLVWICSIYDYYRQTGDASLFDEQLPRIREVLSYFHDAPRRKGLLDFDRRYWLFLDWTTLEKDGAPTLYNLWYVLALRLVAEMLAASDRGDASRMVRAAADEHARLIRSLCFDETAGLFHDGLRPDGTTSRLYSVHSQVFAILLGLEPDSHEGMLQKRILPFLRGEAICDPVPTAYWSSYAIEAARSRGYCAEAVHYIRRNWAPWIPQGACWESFDVVGDSASHAWSAHPLFHLMDMLGGVLQESVGWTSVIFKPFFAPGISHAAVRRPTPCGVIESRWERRGDGVSVFLTLPRGVRATLALPGCNETVEGETTIRRDIRG